MGWYPQLRGDLDNWVSLGNDAWSWDTIFPYFLKSSAYVSPSRNTGLNTSYVESSFHGTKGPLVNSFPSTPDAFLIDWITSWDSLGLAADGDPYGGDAMGAFMNVDNIDPRSGERSFSGNSYLAAARARPNLHVFTDAVVEKILLDDGSKDSGDLVAIGVKYSQNSSSKTMRAQKEVILSAGAIGSPKILELSGIGNAEILASHGVPVNLNNSNVGENLQDHATAYMGYVFERSLISTWPNNASIDSKLVTMYPQLTHSTPQVCSKQSMNNISRTTLVP